ncbi:MAG TPA: gamma-glutamyltransferase [Dehalococcoidia bacterium]|jgi:gamma-glutamyltranspeptidase/glutathione hydrolase|nr:gamma-glutamyltransferase [Dehalococcoidia bacterium]HIK88491.1 gamma-glutamyltransferase [Dehalococcoidia bacterium]
MDSNLSPHGLIGEAYRPPKIGSKGAVVSNHTMSTQAGMRILHKGGNAVDAAVAVAFALGMAEPQGSSIGGDGFVMIHMAANATVEVANGTGAAPGAATADKYSDGIPHTGILGTSVPGILDALLSAHEKYGTLTLAQCLEPAIELCEDGVPVSEFQSRLAATYPVLRSSPTSGPVFAPNGNWLEPGEFRRNPDLARTYKQIADQGRDAFYEGDIAREIARYSEANDGLLTYDDLKRHKVEWQEPISINYRGRTVYEAPPNTSGHVLLQELGMYEQFDPSEYGYMTPESVHLMVEAKKLAFADREAYLADPNFVDVPIEGLLSPQYLADRAKLIDIGRTAADVAEGDPWAFMDRSPDAAKKHRVGGRIHEAGSDTTHFCVVDRWGNSVGELQSIQMSFGSCVIAGSTGILMNNRMTYWHLDPNHIDYLNPGQRVRHTMNPVMVFSKPVDQGGRLELVCGTPGGDTQVQTNMQIVTSVFDFGLNVSEAIDGPRWTHNQANTGSVAPYPPTDTLDIELRAGDEVIEGLKKRGQAIGSTGAWEGAGSEGAIQVDLENNTLFAASDPRREADAQVW